MPPSLFVHPVETYTIPIKGIFIEAWHLVKGMKKTFCIGFVLFFLIILAVSLVLGVLLAFFDLFHFFNLLPMARFFAIGIVEVLRSLLSLGFVFLALNHQRGKPIEAKMIFSFKENYKPLLLIAIIFYLFNRLLVFFITAGNAGLYQLLGYIGTLLYLGLWLVSLVLSLYLSIYFMMLMLLVLDKKMSMKEGLTKVFKAINQRWVSNISLIFLATLATFIGGLISLGIGLIWLLPLLSLIVAIQYSRIFCRAEIKSKF